MRIPQSEVPMLNDNKWNYDNLIVAVNNSISIAQTLIKLGLKPQGSNYKTLHKYISKYNIDTSHWLGKAHLKGQERIKLRRPLEELLVKNDSSTTNTSSLKNKLITAGLLQYECKICKLSTWLNNTISLHLDHINGDSSDNRIENIRLLCPNCHSQTETYCGKKNKKDTKTNYCYSCSCVLKTQESKRCKKCEGATRRGKNTKIFWPALGTLKDMLNSQSYETVAKTLGVSSQAIRKHIKKLNYFLVVQANQTTLYSQ
jgi:hypothetical protein